MLQITIKETYLKHEKVTITYGLETSSNKTGRLFVLVSTEKNAVISCEFKISKDFDKNSELALELLKGIKVTKQFDEK